MLYDLIPKRNGVAVKNKQALLLPLTARLPRDAVRSALTNRRARRNWRTNQGGAVFAPRVGPITYFYTFFFVLTKEVSCGNDNFFFVVFAKVCKRRCWSLLVLWYASWFIKSIFDSEPFIVNPTQNYMTQKIYSKTDRAIFCIM